MKKEITLFLILSSLIIPAQEYKDVAGIFYARCTNCHHTDSHEYPFMNYTQTFKVAPLIQQALIDNVMPPWSADTTYTRFQHERIITASEKQTILDWIGNGAPKGDTTLAPLAPSYPFQYELKGDADLTLSIGHFTSTSTTSDKYYCFSIPSGLTQDRIIRAFEVVPGTKAMVHHAVITADTTGNYTSDLSGFCYNIPGNLGIGTYAPGMKATVFPSQYPLKAGIYLKAGSKIIIQMHYPEGSAGKVDSTKIRLFFYPPGTTEVRRIYSTTPLQNWNMTIPANSVVTQQAYYPSAAQGLPLALSIYGIMPHSHLLCKSIIDFAVIPGVDTIPLVRINRWSFQWQDYFMFRRLVKVPSGYHLFSKHVYDNTVNNENNPNNPPVTVYAGTDTDDEMLFDGVLFLAYQPGDELIDVEEIINKDPLLTLGISSGNKVPINCKAFPNPFSNQALFQFTTEKDIMVTIEFHDIVGRKQYTYTFDANAGGSHEWYWPEAASAKPGVYFYSLYTSEGRTSGKIIKAW